MKLNPITAIDGYKVDHRRQYPEGTEVIFSNLTPRATRLMLPDDETIFFGLQYFIKRYLVENWNKNFFSKPKEEVISACTRRINNYLRPNQVGTAHLEELHDLGRLPITIMALPEGSKYPLKVPCLVIFNTEEKFFWLTNYLETLLSSVVWGMCTSATTAFHFRKLLDKYADLTDDIPGNPFVMWQGHDFSFRGMFGPEAATMSGAAHLLSFYGTDTLPAIDFLEEYYGANCEKEIIGGSVAATEHSVMCAGGQADELKTFERLIEEIYPSGIVSIVSDSWDFWRVITEYTVALKDKILKRDGKVVFRPDSGCPVKILCGDPDAKIGSPEFKGAVECLWEVFGGEVNSKGYRLLDSHVGLIYGDSITLGRCFEICSKLQEKKFASTNAVFGIGSYTYQYTTRDTYGFAVKATYAKIKNVDKEIFKLPKTGDGVKNSAKGLLAVFKDDSGKFFLKQQATWDEVLNCELKAVFKDGVECNPTSLAEIRARMEKNLVEAKK